jgi:hypothetical protein
MYLVIFIAILALLTVAVHGRSLTSADVANISAAVVSTFGLTPSYGTFCNGAVAPCPIGDNIGALVRLAFHDAAGNGGPNGCIDFEFTTSNDGLQEVVGQLNDMYYSNGFDKIISKADLYVLAANVATQYASMVPDPPVLTTLDKPPHTLMLPFRYGRVDAFSCNDAGWLPDADITWDEMFALFGGRFGMSIKEAVSILGAHSVGRCTFSESGFEGGWTDTQSSFSNEYFKILAQGRFVNNNQSAVWVSNETETIMLMVDVESLFVTNSDGQGSCDVVESLAATSKCPFQSQSVSAYLDFSVNITRFYKKYSTAWKKMTELGYSDTTIFNVNSTYPGIYPFVSGTPSPSAQPTGPTFSPSVSPTSDPTMASATTTPTSLPTVVPTGAPTLLPIVLLTGVPTSVPTVAPSEMPSTLPTVVPSVFPTVVPSPSPTVVPSPSPTEVPSPPPTVVPSPSPTVVPSPSPTVVPSSSPTVVPSPAPAVVPSSAPTVVPSPSSTGFPSESSTFDPSVFPTAVPSALPTVAPSASPTADPSAFPTLVPSVIPTPTPTVGPTVAPSHLPTARPSHTPTATPSALPTASPSAFPTAAPSAVPTVAPTYAFVASIHIYQTLQGIDANTWYSDPDISLSFKEAVAAASENGVVAADVNVTAVTDVSSTAKMAMNKQKYILTSSISVAYTINRAMGTVSETLINSITSTLISNVNGGSFGSLLKSFGQQNGVSSLSNGDVTAVANSISFTVTTGVPTNAPTSRPTMSSSSTESSDSGHHSAISTTNLIIIVAVIGGVALLVTILAIVRYLFVWRSELNGPDVVSAPDANDIDL